ncbi:hypothetical protein [Flavobacterium sp. UBA7663]|uniref:hypothetical protein n=1 Tax=Flavobacterium sp. UBA7663 TaxID=1946557 RepID=UPI0025BB83D2|nr:hypothetical protein [Flavobacterium sp. UBA7663]
MEKDWIMDLQTRKILFVQEFLKLESEKAITHLEKLLVKETKSDSAFAPMSIQEFQKRIDQSSNDSKNGRLTESNELLSEIEKWS